MVELVQRRAMKLKKGLEHKSNVEQPKALVKTFAHFAISIQFQRAEVLGFISSGTDVLYFIGGVFQMRK